MLSSYLQSRRLGSSLLATGGQRVSSAELASEERKSFIIGTLERITGIFLLDFGNTVRGEPVIHLVREAAGKTIILTLLAAFSSMAYAILSLWINHLLKHYGSLLDSVNTILVTLPVFITGIVLIWIFSIALLWLPAGGTTESKWFILPTIVLTLKSGPRIYFFFREFLQKEDTRPYVKTLYAYGIPPLRILIHKLKNVLLPAISFWLIDATSYFAGAIITEGLFSIPGLGNLATFAVFQYDMNLLTGILVIVAFMIFLIGLMQNYIEAQAEKFSQ